ncbi:transposase domain-containing protein, partial [Dysgonomonas termitidis]
DKPEAAGTWIYGRNSPNYYGTCRLHGVNPEAWLTDVLNRLPDTKTEDLHLLLPGAWLPTGQH